MIKYKIRVTDWLKFPLNIVNFNHIFIQLAPGRSIEVLESSSAKCQFASLDLRTRPKEKADRFFRTHTAQSVSSLYTDQNSSCKSSTASSTKLESPPASTPKKVCIAWHTRTYAHTR